jgi:hypothetical protein
MEIIKQGVISSIEEIGSLKIMDFSRCNGSWGENPVCAMNTAKYWMVGRMSYTVLNIDMSKYPQRADWPGWRHAGNHEPLGRAYWNCFFANNCGGTLEFSDSPDFKGTFYSEDGIKRRFYGDIGMVSASTFLVDVLPHMHKEDLWITIPSDSIQVVIEVLYDIESLVKGTLEEMFGI